MTEKKNIATGYVGNALRSSAADHTTTFTDEVFDTERQKHQSEVNTDIESKIEEEVKARELAITTETQARTQNDQLLSQAIAAEQERAEVAEQAIVTKNEVQDQKLSELDGEVVEIERKITGGEKEIERGISDWVSGKYLYKQTDTIAVLSEYTNGYYVLVNAKKNQTIRMLCASGFANVCVAIAKLRASGTTFDIIEIGDTTKNEYIYEVAEDGVYALSYINTSLESATIIEKIMITGLDSRVEKLEKPLKKNKLTISFNEDELSNIVSPFRDSYNIKVGFKLKRRATSSQNPCFNMQTTELISESETIRVQESRDEICPIKFAFENYLGANHGQPSYRECVVNNHGKTFADIGSTWTKSGNVYVLVGIKDSNTLCLIGDNSTTYPNIYMPIPTTGIYEHQSGASNRNSINVTAIDNSNLYMMPAVSMISTHVFADGTEVKEDGEYYFDDLKICEEYYIINPASIVREIKKKVGTYTANPIYNAIVGTDNMCRISLVYDFKSADMLIISSSVTFYQDVRLDYYGFIQQGKINGNNRKLYIPKSLPVDGIDYRTLVEHNITNEKNLGKEYWENPASPPDRWVMNTDVIGFTGGYLFDFGVGGINRKDCINTAIRLSTNQKIYPFGIDSKVMDEIKRAVNAGDGYSMVSFRRFIEKDELQNVFEYNGRLYVYVDFDTKGVHEIEIPNEFVGKKVNVYEKSDNVKLITDVSTSTILVNVNEASTYGYIVAYL